MTAATNLDSSLRATSLGLLLAVCTILYGQGLGIVFGLNEDVIKDRLKAAAVAVRETRYEGDDAAIATVLGKSWAYMQRAHLHAGGMGTTALALIVLVERLGASRHWASAIGLGLGAGGFGYSVFWMWAGFRAPGLGSTGLAKESLAWLAMPSSGAFVLATLAVIVLILRHLRDTPPPLAAPSDRPRAAPPRRPEPPRPPVG